LGSINQKTISDRCGLLNPRLAVMAQFKFQFEMDAPSDCNLALILGSSGLRRNAS
jgi:hypothetical protein